MATAITGTAAHTEEWMKRIARDGDTIEDGITEAIENYIANVKIDAYNKGKADALVNLQKDYRVHIEQYLKDITTILDNIHEKYAVASNEYRFNFELISDCLELFIVIDPSVNRLEFSDFLTDIEVNLVRESGKTAKINFVSKAEELNSEMIDEDYPWVYNIAS